MSAFAKANLPLNWQCGKPTLPILHDWEQGIRNYFGQSADITRVDLDYLRPGRSGASVLIATPWELRNGQETQLQPELVKLATLSNPCNLEQEIGKFRLFAEGTALVYGQRLARDAYLDRAGDGMGVFGYRLFEAGKDCIPFYALAMADLESATLALNTLLGKLTDWYGRPNTSVDDVPWSVDQPKLQKLLDNLNTLDPRLARAIDELLSTLKNRQLSGGLSRVHGDLHLENVLIDRGGARPYLIDFGSASELGSPCMDLARLECDLIYRLLPYDVSPDGFADFENSLWNGNRTSSSSSATPTLVSCVRRHATNLLLTPNGQIWFLLGRVLNGLRMLAGTWHEIIPYGNADRRAGILASLGVVSKKLKGALEGRGIVSNYATPPEPNGTGDTERSLRWLFRNRKYSDAWTVAREVTTAQKEPVAVICLLGALAGLSGGYPLDEVNKLFDRRPRRLRVALLLGLKSLYEAMISAKTSAGAQLRRSLRSFANARKLFAESGEFVFDGIAADQLARVHMHLGDFERAKVLFAEAISVKELTGDKTGLATTLGGQALLHLRTLDYSRATEFFRRDLELTRVHQDMTAEVKLHNWLGQAILEDDLTRVFESLSHFRESIRLAETSTSPSYNPELDIAYAHLGCGSCFTRTDALMSAEQSEQKARSLFERAEPRVAKVGVALVELLSGEIALLQKEPVTGMFRLLSGLDAIMETEGPLSFLDYGVRECRFLRRIDCRNECRSIAMLLRGRLKELKSLTIHEILADLENV